MRVPVLLAGYDPSRPFRQDFSRPAGFVVAVRRARSVAPSWRKTYLFEGACVVCDKRFSRQLRSDRDPPQTCSRACSSQLNWRDRDWRER